MASFLTVLKGMPQLQGVPPETVEGLADDALLALYGVHRWPFLKKVNRSLTWTADSATKAFPGIARITTIRYPDTSTQLRPLKFRSDADFAQFKYDNPNPSKTYIWRDAGLDGNDITVELYAVPSSNVALITDFYEIPKVSNLDATPSYFRRLVRLMVLSEIPNSGVTVINVDYQVREAIARAEDEASGELDYVAPDDFIEATMEGINNPS